MSPYWHSIFGITTEFMIQLTTIPQTQNEIINNGNSETKIMR